MKIKYLFFATFAAILTMISCGQKEDSSDSVSISSVDVSKDIVGDSMIYGLACEGTSDSNIVVYPFSGGDPIKYSCIDAHKNHRIIGHPEIGDWVGLVLDKEDTTVATMVVNLDQLKGTWTYTVMPTFKDFKHLSKRMQKKMESRLMEQMPDSEKALYMVPREYGFSLKRSHNAEPVGRVRQSASVDEDSPVEYPAVKQYAQWFSWNGKLILVSQMRHIKTEDNKDAKPPKPTFDTLEYVMLTNDTLVLMHNGVIQGYHRKSNALTANEHANKKAAEADKKAAENLK